MDENYKCIEQALTNYSRKYPEIHPNQEELLSDFFYDSNEVRNEYIFLQPKEENLNLPREIVQSIRDYLGSDKVLLK